MARIRSLKPEFWDDRKLARSTSRDARMLYMGLWNQADEHGRLNGDELWLKGRVFPYDDDIQPDDVTAFLDQLEAAGRLERYEVDGDPFIYLPKLAKHQRLEPAKVESKIPAPSAASSAPSSDRGADSSEPRAHESAPDAEPSTLLYGSGSMEHGSGSMVVPLTRDATQDRPDVDRLCEHLAARIISNGAKPPTITKGWRDAARLMLDNDKRTEADVHTAIDWCQDHEFWRANVLSMPKLREQYDQLSLQARRGRPGERHGEDPFDRAAIRLGAAQ